MDAERRGAWCPRDSADRGGADPSARPDKNFGDTGLQAGKAPARGDGIVDENSRFVPWPERVGSNRATCASSPGRPDESRRIAFSTSLEAILCTSTIF